jgi:hypothetical protein
MNYMYTLRLGSANFAKSSRPFQKPGYENSDIKEVQNLKFRYWLGVVARNLSVSYLTHSCNRLTSL